MMQRYGLWAAALALLACSDNAGGNNGIAGSGISAGGIGGATTTGGNGGSAAGTGASGAPAAGMNGGGGAPGTAGVGPSAGTNGGPVAGMDAAGTGGTPGGEAGSGGEPAAGTGGDGGGAAPTMGSCGPETTVAAADLNDHENLGPWMPTHVERTGPSGQSWIFHPTELGKDGIKHPVFQWGPGAGTGPSYYVDHLNLLASQGFVIISQPSTLSGREALDWLLEQNESQGSMWYQKLDPDRVARGGHSMGALQSFSEAQDPRLRFAVLVCGGASGRSGAANMTYPTLFLGGRGEGGTINFEGDYAAVKGLSVFVIHGMTDHIYCARDNLGPWVAFMRWQFCGEEAKWKKEFMPGGTFCTGEWDECQTKNF